MLIRAATLLALLATGSLHAQTLPLSACAAPKHSIEAQRYELQGTTKLALSVDADGKAANVSVAASSGWKLLDSDAIKLAASCRFAHPVAAATLDVPWVLAPGVVAPQPPVLAAGGCRASRLFMPVAAGSPKANMLVRLQVWDDGQVYAPKFEIGSGDSRIDRVAQAMVQSCRYSPALRDGVPVQSSAVMHLAFDRDKLEEPALRALYKYYLPAMQRITSSRKQYLSAYITVSNEAIARGILAKLQSGESFSRHATPNPFGWSARSSGELDWGYPEDFPPAYAAALRNAAAEGLLPDVFMSIDGWQIIRIDGIRSGTTPTFEQIRAALWIAALEERDLGNLQAPPPPP